MRRNGGLRRPVSIVVACRRLNRAKTCISLDDDRGTLFPCCPATRARLAFCRATRLESIHLVSFQLASPNTHATGAPWKLLRGIELSNGGVKFHATALLSSPMAC